MGKHPGMTVDTALDLLSRHRVPITAINEINHGTQFRCANGAIINVFPGTETVAFQGQRTEEMQELFSGTRDPPTDSEGKIFIVYGHDTKNKLLLKNLISVLGYEPVLLDEKPGALQALIEKLDKQLGQEIKYGVVLWTADDRVVKEEEDNTHEYFQPRPNVILELGMLAGRYGREKVAVLYKRNVAFEDPSDVKGVQSLRFDESVTEIAGKLAKEIKHALAGDQ